MHRDQKGRFTDVRARRAIAALTSADGIFNADGIFVPREELIQAIYGTEAEHLSDGGRQALRKLLSYIRSRLPPGLSIESKRFSFERKSGLGSGFRFSVGYRLRRVHVADDHQR